MNEYVLSQLSYCLLVWMFCNKWLNNRINKIHECPLRTVYNYHQCTFEELLETDNSFTIHERNLQKLAVEMFKLNNELTVQLVSENFNFTENQIILDTNQKKKLNADPNTEEYGKQSVSNFDPKSRISYHK